MAEFQVHGSRAVIEAILDEFSNLESCRLAEPGEFTKIALTNEKLNTCINVLSFFVILW